VNGDLDMDVIAYDQGTSRKLLVLDRDAVVAAPVVAEGIPYLGTGFSRDLEGVDGGQAAALVYVAMCVRSYVLRSPRCGGLGAKRHPDQGLLAELGAGHRTRLE